MSNKILPMIFRYVGFAAMIFSLLTVGSSIQIAYASDCTKTSLAGITPLNDLGTGTYSGYQGGLYPNGLNSPSGSYLAQGITFSHSVLPRDSSGNPSANGRIVFLSIGMSNTNAEFSEFKTEADPDPIKNPRVVIVNGAQGSVDAEQMKNASNSYWTTYVPQQLVNAAVTSNQVQVVWLKNAIANPSTYGGFPAATQRLQTDEQSIVQILTSTFPNLQIVYFASRIYAGYASTQLNPETYAYESGYAVKWLIENHIQNNSTARPWLAWGPYLWANGMMPRNDGLVWNCTDLQNDGTHPSPTSGVQKVSGLLRTFLRTDPTAQPWWAPSLTNRVFFPLILR